MIMIGSGVSLGSLEKNDQEDMEMVLPMYGLEMS